MRALLLGAAGGLASVVMFYSAARGGKGLNLVLLPLMPLPTIIAGFGWGTTAAAGAAIFSAIAIAMLVGPWFAFGYALALGVPVIGLAHLVSLVRYNADGSVQDWFPVGRILMAIALYAAALPVLLIAPEGGNWSIMAADFTRFFKQFSDQAPIDSNWHNMDAAQIQTLVDLWVQLMPAVVAGDWMIFMIINCYLAARIVRVSGRLGRPWPNLNWLTFPRLLAVAFGLAIVGIAAGGSLRVLGVGAAGAFGIAFLLQGLSVVHAIAKERGATWLIPATYAALVIAGALMAPLLALLGVIETLTRFRSRVVPIPPALPLGSI